MLTTIVVVSESKPRCADAKRIAIAVLYVAGVTPTIEKACGSYVTQLYSTALARYVVPAKNSTRTADALLLSHCNTAGCPDIRDRQASDQMVRYRCSYATAR